MVKSASGATLHNRAACVYSHALKPVWHWIASRCPSVMLGGLVVALTEAAWLVRDGYALNARRASLVLASSIVALLCATLLAEGVYALAARISDRWAPVLVALLSLPGVIAVTISLFSGGMIREMPGVACMRVGFALVVCGGIAVAVYAVPAVLHARSARAARLIFFVLATIAFSYVDNHILVGLYPAFHFIAMACTLYAAAVFARLVFPSKELVQAWRLLPTIVAAAVAAWLWTWNTPSAQYLATYSNGIPPKLRRIGTTLLHPLPATQPAPLADRHVADIRLRPTSHPEIDRIRQQAQNIVLVVIDALRADYVGKMHNGKSLTPHLDGLKQESIAFTTVYSPGSFTGKAMPSLMSSFSVPVVDTISNFDVSLVSWLEHLSRDGRRSFANGLCDHVGRSAMFRVKVPPCFGAEAIGTKDGLNPHLVDELLQFSERAEGPFAVYTHWLDAHVSSRKLESYSAKVALLDSRVGDLIEGLRKAGLWETTMLVVTSDHGYYLGENNRRANGGCCADIQMRTPLIVRLPGSSFSGTSTDTLVSTSQVPATILDVLKPEGGTPVGAESLLHTLYFADRSAPRLVYSGDDVIGMARMGTHKLYWNRHRDLHLLYDLDADPSEELPIDDPDVMRQIEERLSVERQRHTEQSVSLVNAARSEIPAELLAVTLAESVEIGPLKEIAGHFWNYEPSTRTHLLETLFTRNVTHAGPALAAIERRPEDPDDRLLLVMQAFASVPDACDELASGLPNLDLRAKVFLAEVVAKLPEECLTMILAPLERAIADVHATHPDVQSDESRFVAVAAYTLAKRLGPALPVSLRFILRDVLLDFMKTNSSISTLENTFVAQGHLLQALCRATTLDDIDLLASIPVTARTGRELFEKCAASDHEECRTILIKVAETIPRPQLEYLVRRITLMPKSRWASDFEAAAAAR